MESIYKYVIENASTGKLDKQVAIDLIKLIGKTKKNENKEIAIIGMSFRLPRAESIEEFRKNISEDVEIIREFQEQRKKDAIDILNMTQHNFKDNDFLKLAYLDDIDQFDYSFFNISPKEASLMDPNQRIFLQTAWKVLEDAGYMGEKIKGSKTGVYLGYRSDHFYEYRDLIAEAEPDNIMRAYPSNMPAVIASRIAYILNLKGPSILIDTSCSSSLSAVHYACKGLINHECEMAIAGGIKVNILPLKIEEKLGVESLFDEIRTFDNSSDGAVMGEGSIALLLKPLEKAIKDNDNIYAVIKGSAINHDGKSIGIAAPNAIAHEEVLAAAWEDAGINPETLTYLEAHGTGTKLGDPIEIDGIQRAFRRYTNKKQFCAIASIKSWVGHLDNAAGVAGIINAVIALKYKELPYLRYFNRPNANIKFQNSPVYISERRAKWEVKEYPRRCGVSSFGMSGTNCHVVLEEYVPKNKDSIEPKEKQTYIFTLSAKTKEALTQLVKEYGKVLSEENDYHILDICYTASTGRLHFNYRLAIIVTNTNELKEKIHNLNCDWYGSLKDENILYGEFEVVKHKTRQMDETAVSEKDIREFSRNADRLVKEYVASKGENISLLQELCSLYIAGANILWEGMYQCIGKGRKISLPTYPFQNKRCWIEIPDMHQEVEEPIFYQSVWQNKENIRNGKVKSKGAIMIIESGSTLEKTLVNSLSNEGRQVIEVRLKDAYCKVSDKRYEIGKSLEDYILLLKDLEKESILVDQIVHMAAARSESVCAKVKEIDGRLEKGVLSLLHLVKALNMNQQKDKMDLILIAQNSNEVTGKEKKILPVNATLFGLGMDIRWEHPNLGCRCIDIDEDTTLEQILKEINSDETSFKVAYRAGKRYTESLEQKKLDQVPLEPIQIKQEGTYVITGGNGAMGLEIMSYLATKNKINIVSINRTPLPNRQQWDIILQSKSDQKLIPIIQRIRKIESTGSKVFTISADVSSEDQMKAAIDEIKNQFGNINGIFHAAGIKRGKTINDHNEQSFMNMLNPKVKGTLLLEKLTQNEPLDFMVLCSSVATLIGEYGNAGYTSANAFLDSFAAYRTKQGRKTLAIDWSTWYFEDAPYAEKINENRFLFRMMSVEDALNALDQALSKKINNIVIGRLNYQSSVFDISDYMCLKLSTELEKKRKSRKYQKENYTQKYDKKLVLKGRANGVYSDMERRIAKSFSVILGYEEIDINSNFFEIGGDSITITRIHSYIKDIYQYEISVTDLFSYPTVYKLSEYLSNCMEPTNVKMHTESTNEVLEADIDKILDSLEKDELSIDLLVDSFNRIGEM